MWFWPVDEMTELVSSMPAPQFGDESPLSVRIRDGSRFKRFLCFVLTDVRCSRIPQVENHYSRKSAQTAMRLSALRADCALTPKDSWYPVVGTSVDINETVRLE
jgi:hypothetical protein